MAVAVAMVFVATDAGATVPDTGALDRPWVESTATVGELLEEVADEALDLLSDLEDEAPDAPGVDPDAEEWDDPPEPPECSDEAHTSAEAFWIASSCGHDVLILEELSPWDTVYATPDGVYRHESSSTAERTDESGEWEPVDPTLVVDPDTAGLTVSSPLVEMKLGGATEPGEPFANVGGGAVELLLPTGLGEPVVDGNRAEYPVLDRDGRSIDGATLVVRIHPDASGLTPVLALDDRSAATALIEAAGDEELGFDFVTGAAVEFVEGGEQAAAELVDAESGESILRMLSAAQWDSAAGEVPDEEALGAAGTESARATDAHTFGTGVAPGTGEDARKSADDSDESRAGSIRPDSGTDALWEETDRVAGPVDGDLVAPMELEVDPGVVTALADTAMLGDPEVTYPVYVDPTITANRHDWTTVRSGWPTYTGLHNATGSQGVGLCDVQTASSCDRDNVQRMFWDFNEMDVLKNLSKSDIQSATFRAYGTHSYDCSEWSMQLWLVDGPVNSTTHWNNAPLGVLRSDSQYPSHRDNCGDGPGYVYWDATKAAKESIGGSKVHVGLKAATETSMKSWRKYRVKARLTLEYDRPPSKPTGLRVTDPSPVGGSCGGTAVIDGLTPQLRATYSDPDGQSLQADFNLWYGDSVIWNPARTAKKASGSEHVVRVPAGKLVAGRTYVFKVYGYEPGYNEKSPVASCSFKVNRAPSVPVASGVSPAMTCGNWYRSATPTLGAYTSDPDGHKVEFWFSIYEDAVYDTSRRVWTAGWTGLESSGTGSKTTVKVPAGVLEEGRTYGWTVRARDQYEKWSSWRQCEFKVDTARPNIPTITAATAQAGHARYLANAETGGVGVPGRFTFGASGSSDTTKYEYSFGTAAYNKTATPSSSGGAVTIAYTPTAAGTTTLYVRAVDRSGWKSSVRSHRIVVAEAREDGIWTFDESSGKAVDSSTADGHQDDLTFTGGAARELSGPHELFGSRTGDRAFQGNGSTSVAASASPVIDNRESFVISAHVYLDDDAAGSWGTAVSQDGSRSGGFRLGYQPESSGCPTTSGGCWLFGMNTSDGAATTYVRSKEPVQTDEWVHLTGAYDASTGQADLWVCEAGTPKRPARGEPVKAAPTQVGPIGWKAAGALTVGRGKVSGSQQDFWDGQIDNVRVFKGQVVAEAKIRRICQGAEARDFAGNNGALDPTIEIDG